MNKKKFAIGEKNKKFYKHNQYKSLFFILIPVFSLLFGSLQKAQAAADSVVSFSPTTTTVTAGQNFSVNVMINSGSHTIESGDLFLTYSTNLTLSPTTPFTQSATFSDVPFTNVSSGSAVYSAEIPTGTSSMATNTSAVFVTLNFTAGAAGNATINVGSSTDFMGDDNASDDLSTTAVSTAVTVNAVVPPTAAITYSLNRPIRSADSQVITATFSKPMAASPVPEIAISGNNTVVATNMTFVDSTHYTYTYTGATLNGTDTVSLSTGTDLTGDVVTAAPTSGATFTVDNTPPTAAITYSLNRNIRSADSQVITATFSEPMAASPLPKIAISGANTIAATNMTLVDSTHYTYTLTNATGNGTDTIALSLGTDIAGNVLTAAPTSGATFVVDNTPPINQDTVFPASVFKKGGVAVTVVSSADATNAIWFAPSGTSTFVAGAVMTTAGGTATSILAPANEGVYRLYVVDAAGNVSAQSTATLTVDNTAPTIAAVTPVPVTGKVTAPSFTFSSTEGGSITYGGSCVSATAVAASGGANTTVVFNALAPATYTSCTVKVTDAAGNQSATLPVPSFTILWLADLTGTTPGVTAQDYSLLHAAYNPMTAQPGNVADITGMTLATYGIPDGYVNAADYSILHSEYNDTYATL